MEKRNICILDGYTSNPGDLDWSRMEKLGNVKIFDRTPPSEIINRAAGCEIVITNKTVIDRAVIDGLPEMQYIGVLATGYNVVDYEYAMLKGITVTNIPAYGTVAVAQHTFALILELCNQAGYHSGEVKARRWENCADFCFWDYPLIELAGKILGIIGYGNIGKKVAAIASAFGMRVIVYDATGAKQANDIKYVSPDVFFAESDIITLHCPLNPDTLKLINEQNLKRMKKTAFLINTARGGLIEEKDLARALNDGIIAGAAVDVLSCEPPRSDNPLLKAKNCIITPHIAWAAKESRKRLMDIAVDNVSAFLNGAPQNTINRR